MDIWVVLQLDPLELSKHTENCKFGVVACNLCLLLCWMMGLLCIATLSVTGRGRDGGLRADVCVDVICMCMWRSGVLHLNLFEVIFWRDVVTRGAITFWTRCIRFEPWPGHPSYLTGFSCGFPQPNRQMPGYISGETASFHILLVHHSRITLHYAFWDTKTINKSNLYVWS
jgi:hypothetical protein